VSEKSGTLAVFKVENPLRMKVLRVWEIIVRIIGVVWWCVFFNILKGKGIA
jgi:hypothetical protein